MFGFVLDGSAKRARALLGVATIALAWGFSCWHASAQDLNAAQGSWEGTLTQVAVPGLRKKLYPPQVWRMVIEGDKVRMFIRGANNGFSEVKPGKFKVSQFKTNALVYSLDSGEDSDGGWIETESWLLLQKNPDALGVLYTGAVKNPKSADPELLNFFTVRTGEFRRVK